MSPDIPSPGAIGDTITFTASATTCGTPQYKFFLQRPNGSWTAQTAFGGATWAWNTTGLTGGVYGAGVWARETGSSSTYEAYWLGTYTLPLLECTSASVGTAAIVLPLTPGGSYVFNAGATRCPTAQFRFWLLRPGGQWTMVRDYGSNSWTWNTKGYPNGTYQFGVWARRSGSLRAYDVYGIKSYALGNTAVCSDTNITATDAAPAPPGQILHFSADSIFACQIAQFEFWLKPPVGAWRIVVPYQSSNAFDLDTTGFPLGTYQVGVWRSNGSLGSGPYSAYAIMSYQLAAGTCTWATLAPDMQSPKSPPATITFTAGSSFPECPTPDYEFWLLPSPQIGWVILQPYATGTTYALDTTGAPNGPIEVGVWARQPGSTNSYDSYAIVTFWIGS